MNQQNQRLQATPIECVSLTGLYAEKLSPEGIKLVMPLQPNLNHVGTMYAGALFTLAEIVGGATFRVYMKNPQVFPIVKSLNIKFTKPARTDISTEFKMEQDTAQNILNRCLENGKADYEINLQLKDDTGLVVAVTEGFYQLRKGKTL